jgi:sirohydrochlorin cobaltochelatase
MRDSTRALAEWIAAGGRQIGEVLIEAGDAGFELRHYADRARADLVLHERADAARAIATFDEAGRFRPLKTAPNLRRGWRVRLGSSSELREALDHLYPAMIGVWLSHQRCELQAVDLRETLARQTGMYRVTQKITDSQADELIGRFCRSEDGCLKHILWRIDTDRPVTTLPPDKLRPAVAGGFLPLLCHEACNLLVAQAREVVKKCEAKP